MSRGSSIRIKQAAPGTYPARAVAVPSHAWYGRMSDVNETPDIAQLQDAVAIRADRPPTVSCRRRVFDCELRDGDREAGAPGDFAWNIWPYQVREGTVAATG